MSCVFAVLVLYFVEVPKFCFPVCPVSCYPSHLRSVSAVGAWAAVLGHSSPRSPGSGSDTGGGGGRGKVWGRSRDSPSHLVPSISLFSHMQFTSYNVNIPTRQSRN